MFSEKQNFTDGNWSEVYVFLKVKNKTKQGKRRRHLVLETRLVKSNLCLIPCTKSKCNALNIFNKGSLCVAQVLIY